MDSTELLRYRHVASSADSRRDVAPYVNAREDIVTLKFRERISVST